MANAFAILPGQVFPGGNPNQLARTIVSGDFGSPYYDQYSFELQRELASDVVLRVGYVGTQGSDLFQTLDGNPRLPFSSVRENPTIGVIRERSNSAESSYHSLQTSLDKRLSRGFSAGLHYTWSKFIDTASEIFNPSSGEVAVAQDSFDLAADRGVSTYDRPHRLTGNFVYELPLYQEQIVVVGKLLGGWQVSGYFTFQSGAPFTVLNGADPTGALTGIDGLVGSAIRPNINTTLDLSNMTVPDIIEAGGASLFKHALWQRDRRPARASASATSAATRCAPTASATSTSGSSRTRGSAGRTCRSASRCSTPPTPGTSASRTGA